MLNGKGLCKEFVFSETAEIRGGKTVRNLQADAKEHTEDEEQRHLFLFEESKRAESKSIHEVHFAFHFLDFAVRQSQRISGKQQA